MAKLTSMQVKQTTDRYLGWKTLGVFALAYAVGWIGGAGWGLSITQVGRLLQISDPTISILSLLGMSVIRLGVWVPAARIVLKRRLRDLAFQLHYRWWADLLAGVIITSVALTVVFLVSVKAGWLIVEGWMWQSLSFDRLLGRLCISLAINVLVALLEEVAFRAYLLTGLQEAWGQPLGLAVMTIAFTVIHVPLLEGSPPLVTALALLFVAAFGVIFGLAYLHTGSLWLPVGIHFAWDFVENDLLNLSGDMTNPHVIGAVARLEGPSSSAGVGNTVLISALTLTIISVGIWLWRCKRQYRSPPRAGGDSAFGAE